MKKSKTVLVVTFSPGGECLKLADAATVILDRAGYTVDCLDITYPEEREAACGLEIHVDMMLMVAPVYMHRLAPPVEYFLRRAQLFVEKAALVLAYGSCEVGKAPAEARKLFDAAGVPLYRIMTCPVRHAHAKASDAEQPLPRSLDTVGKFILSTAADDENEEMPIADEGFDLISCMPFGVAKRLAYGFPKTTGTKCIFCGECSKICPTGAITLDRFNIDTDKCICCGECVRACPKQAKSIKVYPWTRSYMRNNFAEPKKPHEITKP